MSACGSSTSKNNRTMYIVIGVLTVLGVVAVAIAVPLATRPSGVNTSLQQANELLDKAPVIDGHNDWAWKLRSNLKNSINNISLYEDFTQYYDNSHTDINRLRTGKVGAQFWACYVPCSSQQKDAVRQGLEQMDIIIRMTESAPDAFEFVTTADEIEKANQESKIASLIGVEGGHMIDSSLAALRMYFRMGARSLTLTHTCSTPWVGVAGTDVGLSDFGKSVIREMNRLGMLVDLSHVSDQAMNDVLDVSQAPVAYTHSGPRALCDHPRNVPDDILLRTKENNGIIMINFYNNYVTCSDSANTSDVADHFDYVKELIGADYIGIGADYDGVPRVPTGLEDVSKYPNLISELMMRGWSDEDLIKISRENILRVMREVEEFARKSKETGTKPREEWIPESDVAGIDCRTG